MLIPPHVLNARPATGLPTIDDVLDQELTFHFYLESVPFTEAVVTEQESLGGSESACLHTMQGLARLGHRVTAYAMNLDQRLHNANIAGVQWVPAEWLPHHIQYTNPDVFCSLRMPAPLMLRIPAAWRMLWAQDMTLSPHWTNGVLPFVDELVFVSRYHQQQWADIDPKVHGQMPYWVTRNAIKWDLAHKFARHANKHAGGSGNLRFIHISRPERGFDALMHLWPAIRAKFPTATLNLCRYSSMYDDKGWGQVVRDYDQRIQQINEAHGGIQFLGELNKERLYEAIAAADFMLYPTSQPWFAETNCIAATEAQACGTPFIGSWRGALPETLHPDAAILINRDYQDPEYSSLLIGHLERLLASPDIYSRMRKAGIEWSKRADQLAVAGDWERHVWERLEERLHRYPLEVMRNLDQRDDVTTAVYLANAICGSMEVPGAEPGTVNPAVLEAESMLGRAVPILNQSAQTPEDYDQFAMDGELELNTSGRFGAVARLMVEHFKARSIDPATFKGTILDVACGNGAMAVTMARVFPMADIVAVDYSAGLLRKGAALAERHGVDANRITFVQASIDPGDSGAITSLLHVAGVRADILFCGEFLEHVPEPHTLLQLLERMVLPGGRLYITTPSGPLGEILHGSPTQHRGHVTDFTERDLAHTFGHLYESGYDFLSSGETARGNRVGFWLVSYRTNLPTEEYLAPRSLDHARRCLTTRPYQRVAAILIVRDAEDWIIRCLNSIRSVVDFIVIHDTGSGDSTPTLIKEYSGKYGHVSMVDWPDDFSVARNRTLQEAEERGCDWVLWIDADERLEMSNYLRWYATHNNIYQSIAIAQRHLQADNPDFDDIPCRLFRANRGVKFYGVVHEMPESEFDKGILPALKVDTLHVVHLGYQTKAIRLNKMSDRNLLLLNKELKGKGQHPPRDIAYGYAIRDHAILAAKDIDDNRGQVTRRALELALTADAEWVKRSYWDPNGLNFDFLWPWHQQCLQIIRKSGHPMAEDIVEVVWGFAASRTDRTKPARNIPHLFRSLADAERITHAQITAWLNQLKTPDLRVRPHDDFIPNDITGSWARRNTGEDGATVMVFPVPIPVVE